MNRLRWLVLLGITGSILHAAEKLNSAAELARISGGMEKLSAQVGPRVVQIVTQGVKVAGSGEDQPAGVLVAERGCGSGFFVSSDGYLFTNAHVVANTTRIKVLVQPASGAAQVEYAATVAGTDADNDLALLKIDIKGASFFDLTRVASARQGELALAYGSPMGLSQSATFGMISAVDRQLNADDPRAYIQTDATINPGNSGGPLVNLDGALLGINTMILSQSGVNEGVALAVPLDVIAHAYAGIRKSGSVARPRLGIQPRSLSGELIAGLQLKAREGVLVEDVAPYGPGATAGLLPGDVLVALNAEPLHNVRDLYRAETDLAAGKSVDVGVMRGEDLRLLQITPLAARESVPMLPPSVTEKDNLVFRLGVYGAGVTPAVARTLGGLRTPEGVLVLALAGQTVLAPGDIVHAVNGTPIASVDGLRKALDGVEEGGALVIQIERGGMLSYVTPASISSTEHTAKKTAAAGNRISESSHLNY
jgi:serine protease Do